MRRLLRGGRVWDGAGLSECDVAVDGGVVTAVAPALPGGDGDGETLDVSGCVVLPGLVDMHVHLREPGGEEAETIGSGSAAAAAGGFTDIVAMGNTEPPPDTAQAVLAIRAEAERVGLVRVHPAGCVTRGRAGRELADLHELWAAGVRLFTDDGDPVADSMLMRRALEYVGSFGGVVADHCEDRALTAGAQMNEGEVSGRLGLAGWPSAAEETLVARDIVLAEYTGCRVHLQHVSTAGSVELLRAAKARGAPVTAEVTPHHLTLTDACAESFDPVYKVNPPLRTLRDVEAVRAALADGTIDCIATDHAPHTPERKEEWTTAACGMLGLETALPVVWGLVAAGGLGVERLVDAMVTCPAEVAGLPARGAITEGSAADLCVFDPAAEWEVDATRLHSKSRNTPYAGTRLAGRVRYTLLAGRVTFSIGAG